MTEIELHALLAWALVGLGVVTALALIFVSAPYGRHGRGGWGPSIPSRLGWVLMESPAVLLFAWVYASGAHRAELVPLVLLGVWQLHYVNRTFVFPLRMRAQGKTIPLSIAAMALAFNILNAWLNARWISHLGSYDSSWLLDPRFIAGLLLFAVGWCINVHSDGILRRLRAPGETGYKVPRGGMFRWVSCPNYLGEIIEWIGWAIATWSLAGLAFAIYTVSNVGPRAITHHRWYRERFEDYPSERKALLPGIL